MATRFPELDLIIGGHTHAVLPEGERTAETLIVQAGWWGRYLGTVSVEPGDSRPRLSAKIEPL